MAIKLPDGSIIAAGGFPALAGKAGKSLIVSVGEVGVEWGDVGSVGLVAITGNKTLALSDANSYQMVSAAATITIPANATVAFSIGTTINFLATTTEAISFIASAGVSITSKNGYLALDGSGAAASLIKIAADSWFLVGALK